MINWQRLSCNAWHSFYLIYTFPEIYSDHASFASLHNCLSSLWISSCLHCWLCCFFISKQNSKGPSYVFTGIGHMIPVLIYLIDKRHSMGNVVNIIPPAITFLRIFPSTQFRLPLPRSPDQCFGFDSLWNHTYEHATVWRTSSPLCHCGSRLILFWN